jgi:hypothetical protein
VPLVELTTVAGVNYYTDSDGLVAFYEPGMMSRRVFFFIKADGYEYPDALGSTRMMTDSGGVIRSPPIICSSARRSTPGVAGAPAPAI